MKVIGFCGSGRRESNTSLLLKTLLTFLENKGAETELVDLAGEEIRGCTACYVCYLEKNASCVIKKDIVNTCIAKMQDADAVILGSPAYFGGVSSGMKGLMDRCGIVSKANNDLLQRKLAAGVVVTGRAGGLSAITTMNNFFLASQMIVVGASYWNIGLAEDKGEIEDDEIAATSMQQLADNLLWLLEKIKE